MIDYNEPDYKEPDRGCLALLIIMAIGAGIMSYAIAKIIELIAGSI